MAGYQPSENKVGTHHFYPASKNNLLIFDPRDNHDLSRFAAAGTLPVSAMAWPR
jgi:hypothetical protein